MITLYRIYDHTDKNTLANALPEYDHAYTILGFLKLDLPNNELEIESYTQSPVRKGFGRDPDLH